MGRKKKDQKKNSSSEEDDDDDDDEESESESEDSDESVQQKRQSNKRATQRVQTRKQTITQKLNGDQSRKKVTIAADEDKDYNEKRQQYRKPTTNMNKFRKTQDEDDRGEDNLKDFQDSDEDDYGLQRKVDRKKGPQKTMINTQNLVELKTKARQLDQQNLLIEDLAQQLEEKNKEVLTLNIGQTQDIQEKDKNIQSLNNEKQILANKVGKQSTYLKKLKEKLNFRRERRDSNVLDDQDQSNHEQAMSLPTDLQARMSKKPSIISKLVNYLQYNYPLSKLVHRILNFYTKNEELHFTYISVYFNLSLIFFIIFSPFLLLQIIDNNSNFESQKPFSFMMYHEYAKSHLTIFIVIFICFIIINWLILFYRVSYVRKKDVESEAQSQKDLNNFKLVFSSVNFRLSNYEFMKKQQIALKDRVLLSWKLTDKYRLKRIDYGNWIYFLRSILICFQIGMLIGVCYTFSYLNKQDLFGASSDSILIKMPLIYSFCIIIVAYIASSICYYVTQFELWSTYQKSYSIRIWKSFLIQIIVIYYACLLKSPLQFEGRDLTYIGLNDNFTLLYGDYYCSSEQTAYSLISLYFAQLIWSLITLILPNIFNFFTKRKFSDNRDKFLKNQTPFRVLEETYPIIILNMICYMIIPMFPLITFVNLIVHAIIFFYSWKMIIRYKYQYYSSVSRQFIMGTLVQFYVIGNLFSLIYYAIMSYQIQSSYFVGGDYTKNSIQRICGPLDLKETISSSLSNHANSLNYVNQFFDLISWQPLLWVIIVYLFSLSRLETKTKNVWRNEYFVKSREMQTVKNYFQQQARNFEDKIKNAQKELSNIDTPKANGNTPTFFFDSPPQSIVKSKFSKAEYNQQKPQLLSPNNSIYSNSNSNLIGNVGNNLTLEYVPPSPYNQSVVNMDESKFSFISRQNQSTTSPINMNLKIHNLNSNTQSRFKPY